MHECSISSLVCFSDRRHLLFLDKISGKQKRQCAYYALLLEVSTPQTTRPRLSLLVYDYSNGEEALAGCFRELHRAILAFAWWVTRPLVADLIVVGLTKSLSRRLGGSVLLAPSLLWPPKSLRAWEGDPFYSHFITLLKTQTCMYNSCTYIQIFSA